MPHGPAAYGLLNFWNGPGLDFKNLRNQNNNVEKIKVIICIWLFYKNTKIVN